MSDPAGARYAVVIPAYRPTAALLDLVKELLGRSIPAIVIVDDGSGPAFDGLFAQAAALPRVHLVRHAINLGKGAALKNGMHFALTSFPGLAGVVTADADGQHHPEDIESVAKALLTHPEALTLGSRTFAPDVPWRSRMGNVITRGIMHLVVGRKLSDTQTGLRGIPSALIPVLLRIEAAGYEFELEMLIAAQQASIPIREEPIRTIYETGNLSSHFNPIVDSMKIYFVLLRFTSVSLMTAALDNLIFYLVYRQSGRILESQIAGRLCALVFQYSMLRRSVFRSRQRHRDVLPKFVGLLVINGAASYGAIRWATAVLGAPTMPAKLTIETLLFFANFVIQRSFVFRPKKTAEAGRAAWRLVFPLLLAFVIALEIYGFSRGHLFSQAIWYPGGYQRLLRYIGLFLTGGTAVLLVVPWLFVPLALALAAATTTLAAGPLAVLAPLFFLISAGALGSRLLGRVGEDAEAQLTAMPVGTAAYIFLMTVTARLTVHYAAVWAVLLAVPIVLDWHGVKRRLLGWIGALRRAELRSPAERVSAALLAFVLGMHWLVVLAPEVGADALATHLAVPANIAAHHAYTIVPARIIWAVQPMAVDWAYSIVYLLGGELAARLLNFAFLIVIEALLYQAARRWLSRPAAFFLLAATASTPLVELVTGSLFVENLVAALVLGMMTALWRFAEKNQRAFLYASAVLAGSALAAKFGAFAVLIVGLPFVIWEARRRLRAAAIAAGLFLAAAIPTYAIAWWKTGNPFFPYLNRRFPSPLLPASDDFHDFRFTEPLRWRTPFDLTFFTHRFFEGQDGSFGFQQLLLLPLAVAAIVLALRRRVLPVNLPATEPEGGSHGLRAVSAAIVGLGGGALILASVPNARYTYTVLPLIAAAAAASLGWMAARQPMVYRATLAALAAAVALNIWFLPSGGWYNKDFYLRRLLSPMSASRALAAVSPSRALVRHFHRAHRGEPVLLTGDDDMADIAGDGYPADWHSTAFFARILSSESLPEIVRVMRDEKVRYFIGQKRNPLLDRPEALRELLAFCTVREFELGDYYYARLAPECEQGYDDAISKRIVERPLVTSPAGWYDDFDPAIRFQGNWEHSTGFEKPYHGTISFAGQMGARAELAFEGRSLVYLFTKAFNRGIAEVLIDGEPRGVVDLYSPRTEWQSRAEFCCFAPGRHVVAIVVSGRKNAAAAGWYVDLDALLVER
jgi:glycosyltransferase involved in cell wall biosynthesis